MRSGVLHFFIIIAVCASAQGYDWSNNPGNGTAGNPYEISTPEQLMSIGANALLLDKHFILTDDIVFNPDNNPAHVFTGALIATGADYNGSPAFTGHFDGNGHQIVNLKIHNETDNNIALFGSLFGTDPNEVLVQDLTLVNPMITGGAWRAASMAARMQSCKVLNCHSVGGQVSYPNGMVMGGLIGGGFNNMIENCSSSTDVSGDSWIGGLNGGSSSVTLINCSASGTVTGSGSSVGGLSGDVKRYYGPILNEREEVINCHATGNVYCGTEYGGGLIGIVYTGLVENCSATGSVTANTYAGGLIGYIESEETNINPSLIGPTTLNRCFAAGNISGSDYVGGLVGRCGAVLVKDCYASGNAASIGSSYVGGLIGSNRYLIARCFSTGQVTGGSDVGGLVGNAYYHSDTFLCYWNTESSQQSSSAGGVGKTTAEMMSMETFRGWGDDVWVLDEGNDYPHLAWENTIGELIVDEYSYGGEGTTGDPYQISCVEDLVDVGWHLQDWDKSFVLTDDIVLDADNLSDPNVIYENTNFNKIGLEYVPFTGTFNGKGHRICNMYHVDADRGHIGLFGKIGDPDSAGATVKNLTLDNVFITGDSQVGALAGAIENGEVYRCRVQDCQLEGTSGVGGLVGYTLNAAIAQSSVTGDISYGDRDSQSHAGGIAAYMSESTLTDCYAVCGFWHSRDSNSDGGLAGVVYRSRFENCYSVSTNFSEYYPLAGLIGRNYDTSVINCYYRYSIRVTGGPGSGLNNTQMMQQDSFWNWDFVNGDDDGNNDFWRMCADGVDYPRLSWEFAAIGDFACGDGVDFGDLAALAEQWLTAAAMDEETFNYACDGNGDAVIDMGDFGILSKNWR